MCTLTFLPKNSGYIVTQNRDESPLRGEPVFPFRRDRFLFPKDPDGDGTWMASNGKNVVCVLNGGFEPHQRNPPYRRSRGILPFILLNSSKLEITLKDALGLEPFSLFLFSKETIKRFTWTGENLDIQEFDSDTAHIFQSAPLYSPSVQSLRSLWFEEWLEANPTQKAETILDFHRNGGEGNGETNICMYRPGVRTTAITQIEVTDDSTSFFFQNVLTGFLSSEKF